MNKVNVYENNHGFAFIGDRLIECEIRTIDLCYTDNVLVGAHLNVSHADWIEKISPEDFFASIEDFKANKPMEPTREVFLSGFFRNVIMRNNDEPAGFVIENGRVVEKKFYVSVITLFFGENGVVNRAECPDIPAECWCIEDDAKAHLEITVVNTDGSTKTIPSAASLIKLTDEQRALVADIIGMHKKANAMGIKFVADWNCLYAFNTNNLQDWTLDYDATTDERIDLLSKEYAVDIDVCVTSDENMLNIVRKQD